MFSHIKLLIEALMLFNVYSHFYLMSDSTADWRISKI